MNNSTKNTSIELAIADLKGQIKPNINATAKKYGLVESTLRRRFKGETMSIQAAREITHQRLSIVQEEALICQINQLTDRGLPPTSSIVRNLAEELLQDHVSKNWTSRFVHRHKNRLKSLYLRNIDKKRHKSEYAPVFKQFYDLVLLKDSYIDIYMLTFVPVKVCFLRVEDFALVNAWWEECTMVFCAREIPINVYMEKYSNTLITLLSEPPN